MTIISDATALILLAKVSILETFVNRNDVEIPKIVYEEVTRGREKGRVDSMIVENLIQENRLKINSPKGTIKNKIKKLFNLKKGELEVVSLAYEKGDIILTDDKKCLNTAKAAGIGFITSLDVVVTLYRKDAISKEKAVESIDGLEEYGWYAKSLIKDYREVIK